MEEATRDVAADGASRTSMCTVGVPGLEPGTSASRTLRATKLRYTPCGEKSIGAWPSISSRHVTLLLVVTLPLAAALLLVLAPSRVGPRMFGGVAAAAAILSFGSAAALAQAFAAGKGSLVADVGPWLPIRGADLALHMDPQRVPILLALTGAGALTLLASLARPATRSSVVGALLILAGAAGVPAGANLVMLLAAWEVAALGAYLVLLPRATDAFGADAARGSFVVSRAGDVAFIVATAGISAVFHTVDLQELSSRITHALLTNAATDALRWCTALFVVAAAVRAVQLLFSPWITDTRERPGPLPLLHALLPATSIVLLLRLAPITPPPVLDAVPIVGALAVLVLLYVVVCMAVRLMPHGAIAAALGPWSHARRGWVLLPSPPMSAAAGIATAFERGTVRVMAAITTVVVVVVEALGYLVGAAERDTAARYLAVLLATALVIVVFWSVR